MTEDLTADVQMPDGLDQASTVLGYALSQEVEPTMDKVDSIINRVGSFTPPPGVTVDSYHWRDGKKDTINHIDVLLSKDNRSKVLTVQI